ncbi:amino acid synthesis family protein [Aestuariispira insulae]|uniref:Amino acid synthesis protein n=1 Tax=Aestuariispira insulae TaxID=1461337 RepID=A0A3D9H5N3_9PROT|nr:amino acid synthesis family protein [Aestuariispira insulae]RED44815.1 amino acid synthesis protein [Aestuariispira insulae]
MSLEIRKIVTAIDETFIEGGKAAEKPLKMIAVAAVVKNPWAGEFYEDMQPVIRAHAPQLGERLVAELAKHTDLDAVEAYGKAAAVGMNGEVEHASGFIHTLRFGNKYREAVGGTSYLAFTNKRGGPGCVISIPMMHKEDEGQRSHYLTHEFTVGDAPGPDEILVAIGAATAGRPHARTGNRYQDMEEMKAERESAGLVDA